MYQSVADTNTLEGKSYISYGIAIADIRIRDISPDKAIVDALVEQYNRQALDPLHLKEVVEDFLAGQNQIIP